MVPAPHPREQPPAPPGDIATLRQKYEALPHQQVRWHTAEGMAFRDEVIRAVAVHGRSVVARALKLSPQGVVYIIKRKDPGTVRAWPQPEDLRMLLAALRPVEAAVKAGRPIRRQDPEFALVHQALKPLLERFGVWEIALAIDVPVRKLSRFQHDPLATAEAVTQFSRTVHEALPRHNRIPSDWRER
jgi:hypothetical protein